MSLPKVEFKITVELQLEEDPQLTSKQLFALLKGNSDLEEEVCFSMGDLIQTLLAPKYLKKDIFGVGTSVSIRPLHD